ncbi:MAG: carboxypeptidase-like regulatory domain-containing protein [Kofleriaceae bacterium]
MRYCWGMRVSILAVLIACGGPSTPPPALIENKSAAPAPTPLETPASKDALKSFTTKTRPQVVPTGQGSVSGKLTNTMGEALIGATVVFEGDNLIGELVAISDEHGKFALDAFPPGRYRITVYYNDLYVRRLFQIESDRVSELTLAGWDESFNQDHTD